MMEIARDFAELGVEIEIIDLRTIDEFSLDIEAIDQSVKKTGAVAIVEDAMGCHSMGAAIAQRIYRNNFGRLRHPVALISGQNVPTPVARELEESVLLSDDQIRDGLASLAKR